MMKRPLILLVVGNLGNVRHKERIAQANIYISTDRPVVSALVLRRSGSANDSTRNGLKAD